MESDQELARRALSASEPASRELVRRYERPVFNLIVRMVRDPAVAEDLAQDAFLKMFSRLERYDARYKFSAWILKIAHNTAIDYLRRPRPAIASLDDEQDGARFEVPDVASPDPAAIAEHKELSAVLDAAIQQLRPEYRQVVVLRYQEDLDYDEIADVLGIPLGTVKSYLHRARLELAAAAKAAGWGCPATHLRAVP